MRRLHAYGTVDEMNADLATPLSQKGDAVMRMSERD